MTPSKIQIIHAIKSGRLSEAAILDIAVILNHRLQESDANYYAQLIKEIQEINKPIRQQVDDAIKELDV